MRQGLFVFLAIGCQQSAISFSCQENGCQFSVVSFQLSEDAWTLTTEYLFTTIRAGDPIL